MMYALASAYFLTIVAGFVVVTLSLLLYARFGSPAYLYWALIMLGGTLLIMAKGSTHYLSLTGSGPRYLLASFLLFGLSGELLLGYAVPRIAHGVTDKRIPAIRGAFYLLVVAGLGALVVIEGLTEHEEVAAVRIIVRTVWIGYGYAVLISGARAMTDKNQLSIIRAFVATGAVVLPLMLLAELVSLLLPPRVALRAIPGASLLWLSAYSTLSIVLAVRFMSGRQGMFDGPVPDLFVKAFNISDREREIIRFILQGRTEAHIGDLLFISRRTVVNHVYNIYRKTGVRNRVQLINLVNGHTLRDPGRWRFFEHPK